MLMRSLKVAGVLVVLGLFVAPIGLWPWDHDEVHALVELGRVPVDRFPGPSAQLEKMHRLVPAWTLAQNAALRVLPQNEWGTRLMPSLCGALVVLIAFAAASRARGAWFGWSLGLLLATSQTLLWLSQQGRFYAFALLWLVIALALTWYRDARARFDVLAVCCAMAAVLSHNLTLIIVVLMAVATTGAWLIGSASHVAARRSIAAAAAVAGLYLLYLRPILAGWVSGNTGGTQPLVSFVAQAGIVPVGLAAYGSIVALRDRTLHAWMALLVLCLGFVAISQAIMGNWNPRYGLFFMVPLWVIAAAGASAIAQAMRSVPLALAWLGVVAIMAMPKLASHFIDGSRHDFRSAASAVAGADPHDLVLCNWPATLQYYLEPQTGQKAAYWVPGASLPSREIIVVIASNAWEPVLQNADRSVEVIAEIGKRRLDEQSHLIRVYRIRPR